MRKLIYLTSARSDFADISRYITWESGSSVVGQAFIAKLRQRCAKLASLPGTLGTARPELRPDLRSVAHNGYIIFFRYLEDRLEIVNILDGHRDIVRAFDD